MKNNLDIKRLTITAVLIAVQIVLSRFVSISTPLVKIGFAFLPLTIVAMLYGPLWAGAAGAAADFIGATLFPSGAFFPGFTLTAFLTGCVYGLFLYKNERSFWRICTAIVISQLILHLGLNTVWIWMITGKGFWVILPTRVAQAAFMIPVQIAAVTFVGSQMHLIRPFISPAGYDEKNAG